MPCQNEICNSERLLLVSGIVNDDFFMSIKTNDITRSYRGYVPNDLGTLGWQEKVNFYFCLECGQVQGLFPIPKISLEKQSDPPVIKAGMKATILQKVARNRRTRIDGLIVEATEESLKIGIDKSLDEKVYPLADIRCKFYPDYNHVEVFVNKSEKKKKEKE